jgi:hypothetical protein
MCQVKKKTFSIGEFMAVLASWRTVPRQAAACFEAKSKGHAVNVFPCKMFLFELDLRRERGLCHGICQVQRKV